MIFLGVLILAGLIGYAIGQLRRIEQKSNLAISLLCGIARREKEIMAGQAELEAAVKDLEDSVTAAQTAEATEDQATASQIADLAAQIKALQDQIANAPPSFDTQPLIDRIEAAKASIATLENAPPAP